MAGGQIQHAIIKEVKKQQYENHVIDFGKWRCDVTSDVIIIKWAHHMKAN